MNEVIESTWQFYAFMFPIMKVILAVSLSLFIFSLLIGAHCGEFDEKS